MEPQQRTRRTTMRTNTNTNENTNTGSNTMNQAGYRKIGVAAWVAQALLAAVFLFAGGMKLIMPAAALVQQSPLPVLFLRFIGVCEVAGALGLVLPGLFRIRRELTPIAAAGLTVIMIGAVAVTVAR